MSDRPEHPDRSDRPDRPSEPGTAEPTPSREPAAAEPGQRGAAAVSAAAGQAGGATPEPELAASSPAGRRVTRRTVNRREVTEHTEETITEDLPLEAYQGRVSSHPEPVG